MDSDRETVGIEVTEEAAVIDGHQHDRPAPTVRSVEAGAGDSYAEVVAQNLARVGVEFLEEGFDAG